MKELEPLRKVIAGVSINTETAHCIYVDQKVVTDYVNNAVQHLPIAQGLYQTGEGQYFIAFWNKPIWDDQQLGYTFVDEAILIESEQAKQWVRNNCPDKFDDFVRTMGDPDKPASIQALTLRMPLELRNHLEFVAKITQTSLNKICLNHITAGMSAGNARARLAIPEAHKIRMPNHAQALDKYEKALEFDDSEEKALAGYAEILFGLFRNDYPQLLPFALRTFYKLLKIKKNAAHALCFADWLCEFYRVTYEDAQEFSHEKSGATGPSELAPLIV